MSASASMPTVRAEWFDGRHARGRPVRVAIENDSLSITSLDDGTRFAIDLTGVRWPPVDRHGSRILTLPDGSSLHCAQPGAWRRLAEQAGVQTPWTERWRSHALGGVLAIALLVAVAVVGYRWGIPWVADLALRAVPASVDDEVGRVSLASLDGAMIGPSQLPQSVRDDLEARFQAMIAASKLPGQAVTLLFRASAIGPNAFALPGGYIIVTDELVALADGDPDMILGVLAHEYGHVIGRHGMRLLLQSALLGTIVGLATGDVGGLITGAPLLMTQLAYSRANEFEADQVSIDMLLASGRSPAAMAEMMTRLAAEAGGDDDGFGVLLSSHPASAERIRRFREAAAN
ncbi:MAG: M48 family metallopeptidase [Burkholderiaceae bacterium]